MFYGLLVMLRDENGGNMRVASVHRGVDQSEDAHAEELMALEQWK